MPGAEEGPSTGATILILGRMLLREVVRGNAHDPLQVDFLAVTSMLLDLYDWNMMSSAVKPFAALFKSSFQLSSRAIFEMSSP